MADPTYPLFSIVSFIGFILSLIPLPWHLQAWNSGTCYFMMWSALACLNQFINSVVWAGNVKNHSPLWCEICAFDYSLFFSGSVWLAAPAIRIIFAASVGLPASSLCINRRLYRIASAQLAGFGHTQVRWTTYFLEPHLITTQTRNTVRYWLTHLFV